MRPIALSGTDSPATGSRTMIWWLGITAVVGLIFWGTLRAPAKRSSE